MDLWPPFIDGGKLALSAQKSLGCFVLIVTGHGTVVYVSDAVESLLGHDQINLVGRSVKNLIHPEELSVLATQFSLVTGAGHVPSSRSFYTRMLNAEKSQVSKQVFELVHVTGHMQEVALASSSDCTMGQKETWLMCACKVMSHVPEKEGPCSPFVEWVSHNELNGKIIDIDARSCQVTGYLPREMMGLSPYCFIHPDDQEHVAFFHNQALFDSEGASTCYRMYTSSHDIVFVHTTMQLSSDKVTNRPKSLFCIHRVVSEKEGLDQISKHHQQVMWSKTDPSSKFSMADIELMVKALEERGVAPRNIPSKGGMMNSRLTDSCTLDGGDLLNRNLSQFLTIPSLSIESGNLGEIVPNMKQGGRNHGRPSYARNNSSFHQCSPQQLQLQQQQQQPQHLHQNLYSPISPIGSVGSTSSVGDGWVGKSQTRHPKGYRRLSLHQQQAMMSPPQSRSGYQHQLSMSSSSPMSTGGSTPRPDSPVSFIDLLNEASGPHSVPPDNSIPPFSGDLMSVAPSITPGVRGRGRGRSRGRPRGSGRGARGCGRGVGRPRGTRGGRGRGRARGAIDSMAHLHNVMGSMRKVDSLPNQGSLPTGRGRGRQGMLLRQSMSMDMSSAVSSQMLTSHGDNKSTTESSPFTSLIDDDEGLVNRNSIDSLDFLDTKSSSFDMQQIPNMEIMSPLSLSSQDSVPNVQISPYQNLNELEKDSSQQGYHKHNIGTLDLPQSNLYQDLRKSQCDVATMGAIIPFSQTNMSTPIRGRRKGTLQHSLSLHGTVNISDSQESDVEHSILGNLLKGKGGSASVAGSKSPIQALGLDVDAIPPNQALPPNRWSPSQAGCGNKAKWVVNPMSTDRDSKSLSASSSPASVFSPESAMPTPTTPKGRSPHSGCQSLAKSNAACPPVSKSNSLQCDNLQPMANPGITEMQMFSAQLRQKHKTLENNLVFQDKVLRHLESTMQQASSDIDTELLYAQFNARLDNIKASKVEQEQELRSMQATLESQVQAHYVENQLHQQNPQQINQSSTNSCQSHSTPLPMQPSHSSHSQLQHSNSSETQPRVHLNNLTSSNHRRMAIVPPIQRQVTEEETSNLSQSNITDMKSSSGVDSQCGGDSGLDPVSPSPSSKISEKTKTHPSSNATSVGTSSLATALVNQVPHPQSSPFSLHHHHHHHHHYHHPMPILPNQQQGPSSRPSLPQQNFEYQCSGKVSSPPPPYKHTDIFPSTSSAAMPSPASTLTQTALNISVSSLSTSLTSPIVCDTSPISVDESPSCASDTSSGYHSLSLSADPASVSVAGSFSKPHDGTAMVSGLIYQSKTPPASSFHSKMGNSSELLTGPGDFNPSASM